MTGAPTADCHPFFIESAEHRLFSLAVQPAGPERSHGVLVCPPFGEEMNRCRRTVRVLLGELARRGVPALSLDLRGTGDSSGEFGDARWEDWVADLARGLDWLREAGCPGVTLVAVRAGALLAWDLLRARRAMIDAVVLWQPVLNGKSVVTDLLRARVAAAAAAGATDTVARLRAELAAGRPVETAGYTLSPALAAALESATLAAAAAPPVHWIEVGPDPDAPLRAPAAQLAAALAAAGTTVQMLRAADPPFWGTTETTTGRATVSATVACLAAAP